MSGLIPLGLLLSFLPLQAVLPSSDDATRAGAVYYLRAGAVPDQFENKYSLIQPLLSVPQHVLLEDLGFGLERSFTLIAWTWVVAWSVFVWWLVRREHGGSYATKVLVLCLVSLTAAYVVGFSGDVFSLVTISGGVLLAYLGRRALTRGGGWALAVLGAANTPALGVALAAIALTAAIQRHRLRYLAAPVAAGLLVIAEASWATGSLTATKYTAEEERGSVPLLPWGEVAGFGWPLWSGLLGVLFSFGRGLIFFLPLWVAGFPPRSEQPDPLHQAERALWVGVIVMIPIYAAWWAWFAGVSFGPRFFLLGTVPTALAVVRVLTGPRRSPVRLTIILVAVVLSAWIAIAGVTYGVTPRVFTTCASGGFELAPLCWHVPEYSHLWAPIWVDEGFARRWLPFIAFALAGIVYVGWEAARDVFAAGRHRASAWLGSLRAGEWRI